MAKAIQVIVAGHICLDVIPTFGGRSTSLKTLLTPGTLIEVGDAVTATGGAVANTGLALHRLGIPTRLVGKVGNDLFGHAILDILRRHDATLVEGMIVSADASSSYTIVISPPGVDRLFVHGPGANDTFGADDVDLDRLEGARLFHFGYPPAMRRMYADGGAELMALMQRAKAAGLTTSLDMTYPDPNSEAGRTDWEALLERVLPHVDLFLPSVEEALFLLGRHDELEALRTERRGGAVLADLADQLLGLGAAVVVLKLGAEGLYLRTTPDAGRWATLGAATPYDFATWCGRELLAPCFEADVAGTTGAGDSTIASFLAGLLKDLPPEDAMTCAVAVGACSVERPDATSGVPDWEVVQARIAAGWKRQAVQLPLPGWQWDEVADLWVGPHDVTRTVVD